jgi:hypothetical protein
VQYHPEAAAGPHDAQYLFDRFAESDDLSSAVSTSTGATVPWPPPRQPPGGLMPRRTDLRSVLVIGSGRIVIGQACEFDYSGTQACRVLKPRACG